jgi:hypothetical protein
MLFGRRHIVPAPRELHYKIENPGISPAHSRLTRAIKASRTSDAATESPAHFSVRVKSAPGTPQERSGKLLLAAPEKMPTEPERGCLVPLHEAVPRCQSNFNAEIGRA